MTKNTELDELEKKMTKRERRRVDIKADKTNRWHLQKGKLRPGFLMTFTYDPKWKDKKGKNGKFILPFYDRSPLCLMLTPTFTSKGTTYFLGLNLNHPRYKGVKLKSAFGEILDMYAIKKQIGKDKNGKPIIRKYIDIDYKKILDSDPVLMLKFGVRLYIRNRVKVLKSVPIQMYDLVGTKFSTASLRARMTRSK